MKKNKELSNQQNESLTFEQKLRQKKMLIYPLLFIVFGLCIWYIFSPSKSEKFKKAKGFNTTIPMPKNKDLTDDKKTAFEQAKLEENQGEQKHSLQSLASMFNEEMKSSDASELDKESETQSNQTVGNNSSNNRSKEQINKIQSSNNAYRKVNQNLGSFFESSKTNTYNKPTNQKMEELSDKIQESNSSKSTITDQIELMEKSYQMAAKYIPQGQVMGGQNNQQANRTLLNAKKKRQISSINQQIEQIVSCLPQTIDSVGMSISLQPHNKEFNTVTRQSLLENRNTIKACVHMNCSLITGQSVRLRLLEVVQVGKIIIPPNTLISGEAKIQGDRLVISIQSLEYQGDIIPVELTVYDTDGQEGIYIPGSLEINAFKEMAGNIGSNMGTSISLTQSAGQQVLSGLGKGVIQSGSQYLSKKFQTVNIKLKAGYKVFLLTNQE